MKDFILQRLLGIPKGAIWGIIFIEERFLEGWATEDMHQALEAELEALRRDFLAEVERRWSK